MEAKALLILGVMISVITVGARADSTAPKVRPLETLKDYKALHPMEIDAFASDAAKQEQIAELHLRSRGRSKKSDQRAGVHFLLRAATMGRPTSMLRLADALDRGAFGFKKLPAAANCWSSTPSDFEKRLACLSLTDLRDARARIPCNYFTLIQNGLPPSNRNAATMARLVLQTKPPRCSFQGLHLEGVLSSAGDYMERRALSCKLQEMCMKRSSNGIATNSIKRP